MAQRVMISVHDLPKEIYDALDVEEQSVDKATWKTIQTGSSQVTYFRTEPGEYNERGRIND